MARTVGAAVMKGVRKDKPELVDTFINPFALTPQKTPELSVFDAYKPYFLVRFSDEFVVVDFTNVTSVLVDATSFALEQKDADQLKNLRFERDLEMFLRSQCGVSKF